MAVQCNGLAAAEVLGLLPCFRLAQEPLLNGVEAALRVAWTSKIECDVMTMIAAEPNTAQDGVGAM